MKKWLLVFLTLLFSTTLTCAMAEKMINYTCGDWMYTLLENGTAEVIEYLGNETHIKFPAELDGYSVTSVGGYFCDRTNAVTEITIPGNITNLSDFAMCSLDNMEIVNFEDGEVKFGEGVFSSCQQIQNFNVSPTHPHLRVVNDALIDTATCTYIRCPKAADSTSVIIPEGILNIDYGAFCRCTKLTSIIIPDGVTHIGAQAFLQCESLTMVELPESITHIGNYAFSECWSLEEIQIPTSVISLGGGVFSACRSLKSVALPDSLTVIPRMAFYGCWSLETVVLPKNLTTIKDMAFYACEILRHIELPNGLEEIGSEAFAFCYDLTSSVLTLSNTLTDIASDAFNRVNGMEFCVDPGSYAEQWVESNGFHSIDSTCVFTSNDYLYKRTSVNYGDEERTYTEIIRYLGTDTELIIPAEMDGFPVTSIRRYTFYKHSGLTAVTIPDSIIGIDPSTFSGCEKLTTVHLPDSLLFIFDSAFSGCEKLSNIEIPAHVTQINAYAFYDCTSLTDIVLPEGIRMIGDYAFKNCSSLTSVTFPRGFLDTLSEAGKGVFDGCNNPDAVLRIYRDDGMEAFCKKMGVPYSYVD